ncbi:MAG: DUF6503 family protein [Bacteroidota bacterium]
MKVVSFFFIVFLLNQPLLAQQLTGPEVLDKAIAFHDPNGIWPSFIGTLQVTMETPSSSERHSIVHIDIPNSKFGLEVSKDGDSYTYRLEKEGCEISLNGSTTISMEDREKFRLSCERGKMYRNYYTYLYGLPMKLKDTGTQIHDKVTKATFKGKTYLKVKATYDAEVGEDTWYFYFDPETYAMEVYQFFHEESKNDGEYILLSGMEEINGIKMPKIRKWYYNKDDTYLGTDNLN